jgi:hypothetical protein
MEFYVIDDLSNQNYPTPRDIVFRLETSRDTFASRIPYWDSQQPIEIVDEYLFDCFFEELPIIDTKSYYNSISSLTALS